MQRASTFICPYSKQSSTLHALHHPCPMLPNRRTKSPWISMPNSLCIRDTHRVRSLLGRYRPILYPGGAVAFRSGQWISLKFSSTISVALPASFCGFGRVPRLFAEPACRYKVLRCMYSYKCMHYSSLTIVVFGCFFHFWFVSLVCTFRSRFFRSHWP